DVRRTRSRAGLRGRGCPDPFAGRAASQERRASFRIACLRAHAVAAGNDACDAHPSACKLLRDQRVLEHAEPHTTMLGADHDAEIAHASDATQEVTRYV